MVNLAKFKGRIRFNDLSSDFIYKIIRQKILIDFGLDKPDIVAIENISGISKQNEKKSSKLLHEVHSGCCFGSFKMIQLPFSKNVSN